jgi:hypothetical protein
MPQTQIAFDHHPADPQVGFDIGWDHAHHGLVPPPAQLHEGNPVRQGWQAGKACFGTRTLGASRLVRQWLQLRLHAWQRGRVFELAQVTPHYLGQLDVLQCPITRQTLQPGEASVDRVCDAAGYAAGNLALMSARANRAKGAHGWQQAQDRARQAQAAADGGVLGLDAAAWARLSVLISFVTPLPHARAACVPLLLQPPNRLRLLNPIQGLQALITRELGRPDGARRLRALTAWLPGDALRLDFHQFLTALWPRLIGATQQDTPAAQRHTLEDAWRDALVNRRWQRFALQLDDALVDRLLQQGAGVAFAGTRMLLHERATATEGWALETAGLARGAGVAPRRPPAPLAGAAGPIRARMAASRTRTADGHLPA